MQNPLEILKREDLSDGEDTGLILILKERDRIIRLHDSLPFLVVQSGERGE